MKIKYFILFCIFSLSCGFSSDDPWDLKINPGDQFSNRERSVYLQCSGLKSMTIEKTTFLMLMFDIKDKETDSNVASFGAHYFERQNNAIVFGVTEKNITNNQLMESIQTAMGIFRAKHRSNLLFEKFVIGILEGMESEGLKLFCQKNFTQLGSDAPTSTEFFEIAKRK